MPLSQSQSIDGLMEDASEALARMAYLRCEAKCLEALALARRAGDCGVRSDPVQLPPLAGQGQQQVQQGAAGRLPRERERPPDTGRG